MSKFLNTNPKFKYGEISIIDKGFLRIVKVGVRFDSNIINKRRNKSHISYYIDGYDMRDWCFEEELIKVTPIHWLMILIIRGINIYKVKS